MQAASPTNTAPTLAALPSQTWTVGTAVNVNLASYGADAQGAITFTATGLPAGVSISATGLLTGTPTAVASSSATITVTDTGGLTAQQPLTYTVQAASPTGADPQNYNIIVDLDTPRTLTGSDVGAIQTEGKNAYVWPLSSGTTALPTQGADGSIVYSGNRFHNQPSGLSIETADGIILVADFTPTALNGTQTVLTAGYLMIRASGTVAQGWYSNALTGTAANISMGTLVNGQRATMAIYIDRTSKFIRWLNITNGQIEGQSIALTADLPNVTVLGSGQNFIGSIHNRALVFQKKGESLSRTFTQVISDFSQGA